MKNPGSVLRAVILTLLAGLTSGCMGMRIIEASTPVSTGAGMEPAPAGARIALQVVRHWYNPEPGPSAMMVGIENKFRSQLTALGYEVITPAQAQATDLLLRVDARQHGSGMDSISVIFPIFSAFILPATTSDYFMLDTSLIREGEVLGVSRQAFRRRTWISILPIVLLYGGPERPATYERDLQLNTELLALAQRPRAKGI